MAEHKDEGLLDKILSLVAPPTPSSSLKGRTGNKKAKGSISVATASTASSNVTSTRHPGIQNHPYCDACGDGGNLLCCDTCPASFHFNCCDPPVDSKNIPSGDWLCRRCSAKSVGAEVPPLFHSLLELATSSNPRVFSIPYEMQRRDILPGSSRKELKQARQYHHHHHHHHHHHDDLREQWKHCYACNKNSSHGRMASCDFCPLIFHLDCLHPPLTIPPTTVWMCPVHPNSKIPGFDHPRLTQRLKALEKGQADVPHHIIKADFIRQLRKIPHYKRITHHHNRRVTEVPSAIKSLYENPLLEAPHVPSISDSILTPKENMSRWRMEEEMDRKLFTSPRQNSLTHNQDEWTRREVLCQLQAPAEDQQEDQESDNDTEEHSEAHSRSPSVTVAAQQLLMLSALKSVVETGTDKKEASPLLPPVNGVIKPLPHTLTNDKMDVDLHANGTDELCPVEDTEHDEEMSSAANSVDGSVPTSGLPSPHSVTSPAQREGENQFEMSNVFVPDLTQLDPSLVHLLALQRVQQLLAKQGSAATTEGCSGPLDSSMKTLNEQEHQLINRYRRFSRPHRDSIKRSVLALLCPLSGTALSFPLHKQVTLIGTGSEMDVCLQEHGHCNYISPRQACIFYDKVTQEYELINYSEHGTIVDGVLYSCDFSNKCTDTILSDEEPITLDHVTSLGKGHRGTWAHERLENARKLLKDEQEAKRALESALRLSTPVKDDLSLAEEMSKCEGLMTRTGLKRVTMENVNVNSSVVSIPLSKTKKSETVNSNSKKGNTKNFSPARSGVKDKKVDKSPLKQELVTELQPKKLVGGALNTIKAEPVAESLHNERQLLVSEEGTSHQVPCGCRRSPSSVVSSSGKGWEGTATLYHGSKLRFGCLQFVLSLAGQPGHAELVQALSDQMEQQSKDQ